MTDRMDTLLQTTSPTPTGQTPGLLSNATSRQAVSGARGPGSTKAPAILLAVMATAAHRLVDGFWNELHILFYAYSSSPNGPTLPSMCSVASMMNNPELSPCRMLLKQNIIHSPVLIHLVIHREHLGDTPI